MKKSKPDVALALEVAADEARLVQASGRRVYRAVFGYISGYVAADVSEGIVIVSASQQGRNVRKTVIYAREYSDE
jgi:hypothetical protein